MRSLPFVSHWNPGKIAAEAAYGPAAQLQLIQQGHKIIPWVQMPQPTDVVDQAFNDYYAPLAQFAAMGLPIVLLPFQWDLSLLQPKYASAGEGSPVETVTRDGKSVTVLSPFGSTVPWYQVGNEWVTSPGMQAIQKLYPNPKQVIFLSNNESPKLLWTDAENSLRYTARFGFGGTQSDDMKRLIFGNAWIERNRSMLAAMRRGLVPSWQGVSQFVGYGANGPPWMGRWPQWQTSSLDNPAYISPDPLCWDGASTPYYVMAGDQSSDYTVNSPQVGCQNQVFMMDEAYRLNPNFWLEMSVWDGWGAPNNPFPPKPAAYRSAGQIYDPARYAAFIQFGMWILRPNVVREYRDTLFSPADGMPYLGAMIGAVDKVWSNSVLADFWQNGTLVPDGGNENPYQSSIPDRYTDETRWYMLNASVNTPVVSWSLTSQINVFALALVQGIYPKRRWLIYSYSPLQDRKGVTLGVPSYGAVKLDVSRAGAFYLFDEQSRKISFVI